MPATEKLSAALLATLAKLEAASREVGGLSLFKLYNDRDVHAHVVKLQRMGFWHKHSATQGYITDAGCAALVAA